MKNAALILALGAIVLSCNKKETDNQTNTSDTMVVDSTPASTPMENDSLTTIPSDSASSSTMTSDTANTAK